MMWRVNQSMGRAGWPRLALCAALLLCAGACAASRPPDAAGPRSDEPPYPVLLMEDPARVEVTLAAWTKLTQEQGITQATVPELQPVTATIRSLPALPGGSLRLPKVGLDPSMSEEEIRRSLKIFIENASQLLGVEMQGQPPHLQRLSLVQRTDGADGTEKARYQQYPFRYPLRGGYGVLEISFTPDQRIQQISSTCITNVEGLQRALSGVSPVLTSAEEVARRITGRTLSYTDATGSQQTYTVLAGDEINARELVIYTRLRTGAPSALEFHLAWEVSIARAPERAVYLDAVTGEIIAAT